MFIVDDVDYMQSCLKLADHNMIRYSTRAYSNFKNGLTVLGACNHEAKLNTTNQPKRNLVSSTLSNPSKLPHYPVPELQDTLQKFLRSVQPLLTPDGYQKTEKIVADFGSANGDGSKLHKLLKKRADSVENWLADWWLQVAYLGYRIPVVVNSNPGLYFDTLLFANQTEWLQYTAKMIWATLRFKEMIDLKQIPADKMGKAPLDMQQYGKIFGTCRIPAPEYDKIEYNPDSRYVIVAYRNGFYKVPVYAEQSHKILSEQELFRQLSGIVQEAGQTNPPIGALTAEHRDKLATAYQNLITDPENRKSVDCITKSLFIVCLDQAVQLHRNDHDLNVASHQFIHGGGAKENSANRWFDKTLQLIINENGLSGLNYEHSPGEGQPIAVLSDFIIKHTKSSKSIGTEVTGKFEKPTKLKFNVTSSVAQDVDEAVRNTEQLAKNLHMNVIHFKGYGKNFIKSQKMSPDSYIQMAMQYAFYKYHGEPGAHYETAQQRLFIHGRTETIRSCSLESIEFAKGMCNDAVNDNDKVQLLKAAVNGHKNYTTMAMNGAGIDRHLLGLKLIARENGLNIPAFYSDDGYLKSTNFRISTSQVASTNKIFMCYGPVVEDGYGICYNPRDDDMLLAVSSFPSCPSTSASGMGKSLTDALEAMYGLLVRAGEKPKSKI